MTTPIPTSDQLIQALYAHITGNNPPTASQSSFARPEPFKGAGHADARRFISQFESWSSERPDLKASDPKKIRSALGLFSGEAATSWSSGPLEAMSKPNPPWTTWDGFKADFNACWLPANETAVAQAQLEKLRQGARESVSNYAAKFTDIASRTDLEDSGKKSYFLRGLLPGAKMWYAIADGVAPAGEKAKTFLEAKRRAIEMDVAANSPLVTSTTTPVVDPYAMDVDTINAARIPVAAAAAATNNDNDRGAYMRSMGGRCFGCGMGGHSRRDPECRAKQATCHYCGRKGHYETICEDKFCGRARNRGRGARVAATTMDGDFTLFPAEAGLQGPSTVRIAANNAVPAAAPAVAPAAAPTADPTTTLLMRLLEAGFR